MKVWVHCTNIFSLIVTNPCMQNNMWKSWWALGMILSKLCCMQTTQRAFLRHNFFNNRTIVRTYYAPWGSYPEHSEGTQGTMGNYFGFCTTKRRQGCWQFSFYSKLVVSYCSSTILPTFKKVGLNCTPVKTRTMNWGTCHKAN